ncbi:MAG: DUF3048 domain-containing protein [Acidimicrobiales bacterium]
MKPIGGGRRAAVVAVATLALAISACGGHAKPSASKRVTTTTVPPTSTSIAKKKAPPEKPRTDKPRAHKPRTHKRPARAAVHHVALCPLTGLPAPGGHVPRHAGLVVKVENLPQARPQWGIDKADIVFEEPVEGAITRFVAVYDCQSAARIEPVRSGRFDDPNILEPLGKLLFAYAGAVQPVINEVDSRRSLLGDVGILKAPSSYSFDPDRYAPHNLVSSTSALEAAGRALGYPEKPPHAIFSYGPPVPGGTPASQVDVRSPLDVTTWTWRRATGLWYRSYSDTGPAMQGDGRQIAVSNLIVMLVHNDESPLIEDDTGAHEYVVHLKGSGPAWVFRDGRQYFGRWKRPKLADPTVFVDQDGTKVKLTPGTTWEELVPFGGTGPTPTWTGSVSVKP